MSRLECSANPLVVFFFFSFVLFLSFMWLPDLLDHPTTTKPHNLVIIDPHEIRTRIDTSIVSILGSNNYSGKGKVEEFGGLNSYIIGSLDSKRGILVATDVYGIEKPNLRRFVDKIAAAGYYVVAPDLFHGDPFVPGTPRTSKSWLIDHPPAKGAQDAIPVIQAFKSKGISTIGVAGFCWGGKVATLLAARDDLKAVAMAHPAYLTIDDIKDVKVPISILGAEHDSLSPPALLKQFEEILSTKSQVPNFVKIFPGVSHGWTMKYNITDKPAVKSANEAHGYILAWFNKYVKY